MRPSPPIAARQCGVFSAVQAEPHGWTRDGLRWAVNCGQLRRVRSAVFQVEDLSDLPRFERARWRHAAPGIAAVLATPGAVASHTTSAVLRGLPLAFLPRRPCANVQPWHTGDIQRVHLHRGRAEAFVWAVGGVSCMSVERTLVDLGREHGVAAAAVPMDFALRNGLTTVDQLENTVAFCMRWPGIKAAREALAAADPRSESPLESLSRLKFPRLGVPMPEPQATLADAFGRFLGRVDFYWDEFGVVGEVDGAVKYTGESSSLIDEKLRQEALEEAGLIVVRWGAQDLRRFEVVADRLQRAFARGRTRDPAERRWRVLPGAPSQSVPTHAL